MSTESEFHIYRHPEKKGEMLPRQDNPDEMIDLPKEGLQQAQQEFADLAKRVEKIPGAVILVYTSIVPRAVEAGYIASEELRVMAEQLPNSKIFSLEKEGSLEKISQQVDKKTDKVVIVEPIVDLVFGDRDLKDDEVKTLFAKYNVKTADEFIAKWLDNKEMQAEFEDKIGTTPLGAASEMRAWIGNKFHEVQKLFPGRPMVVAGIGHSGNLDAAFLGLRSKSVIGEELEKIGGSIKTMEKATLIVDQDGKGSVEYRKQKSDIRL